MNGSSSVMVEALITKDKVTKGDKVAKEQDKEFVEYVVKALVDKPDKVSTKRSIDERGVLIELLVDPEDMGKIIGKMGQTAKSIRTLLRVVGAKNDARVNLKIIEPEGSTHGGERREESGERKEEKKEDVASAVDDIKI